MLMRPPSRSGFRSEGRGEGEGPKGALEDVVNEMQAGADLGDGFLRNSKF